MLDLSGMRIVLRRGILGWQENSGKENHRKPSHISPLFHALLARQTPPRSPLNRQVVAVVGSRHARRDGGVRFADPVDQVVAGGTEPGFIVSASFAIPTNLPVDKRAARPFLPS